MCDKASKITLSEAGQLSEVINAMIGDEKCARYIGATGDVIQGTARSVTDANGMMVHDADVRDLYLWVTTTMGFEVFWPIRELMADVASGYFVPHYS